MSKSDQLESLLRQVQQRRAEPRARNRRGTPAEAAPPQTQTQPKAPARRRSATPLEQAASKASGFAPRPPSSPSFDSPTAKYPSQPAKAAPAAKPLAAPAPPAAPPAAPAPAPAQLKAEKIAVAAPAAASAPVAKSIGQRPAAKTFGELITRALSLRTR